MPEPTKPLLTKLANGLKNWFTKPAQPRPYKLDVSILEDRILYSATAMPMPDAAPMDATSIDMQAIETALQSALTDAIDTTALQAAAADATQADQQSLNSATDATTQSTPVGTDAASGNFQVDSLQVDANSLDSTLDQIDTLLSGLQSPVAEPADALVAGPARSQC